MSRRTAPLRRSKIGPGAGTRCKAKISEREEILVYTGYMWAAEDGGRILEEGKVESWEEAPRDEESCYRAAISAESVELEAYARHYGNGDEDEGSERRVVIFYRGSRRLFAAALVRKTACPTSRRS